MIYQYGAHWAISRSSGSSDTGARRDRARSSTAGASTISEHATSTNASLDGLSVLAPDGAPTSSLSQQAYYLLRDRIVTLQLAPGSLVNEKALAAETGLGRTPVREALRRLADEDLVDIFPRRGIYVGGIDVGDLSQISEVRVELEGFVARMAAQRVTDADRQVIAVLMADLHALPSAVGQRALIHLDQRIHRTIYRAARNPFLEASLDRYYVLALRLWFLAIERVHQLADAVTDHVDLLTAVAAGDPATAERIARAHVNDFEQQIRALL